MGEIARFPIIIGPTAGGKSSLGVEVALELERRGFGRGEVISADAFQVYRGMEIATAAPTPSECRGVAHHLIHILEPDDPEPFSVHRWLGLAEGLLKEIGWTQDCEGLADDCRGLEAGAVERIPIVVGGTHLYIKALLDGVFDGPGQDKALRRELGAMDPALRREKLERVDPRAALRIHPNDIRRTIRALEVHGLTGKPISDWQGQWDSGSRTDCLLVILDWEPEQVNRRINERVRQMIDLGLVEEIRGLDRASRLGPQAAQALGCKQILAHLRGNCSLQEAVERIKIETRRFAKNQRTWIRRLGATPGSLRLLGGLNSDRKNAQVVVNACLRSSGESSGEQIGVE